MSGVDQITSIIDIQAIQAELDTTKKGIADLVAQIQAVKKTGVAIGSSTSAKEYASLRRELELQTKAADVAAKAAINESKARQAAARAATQEAKATEAATKAKVSEEKATQQNAKAKQVEERYTSQLLKAKEALNREAIKESDKAGKLANAYEQLKFKELQAANTAKQLAAQYGINNKVTQEAIAVQGKYYNQLINIEKAVGQNQRSVGNYTQATFALTQVIREAPAFANSFATGISGISNNIPILVDEIKKLNAANKELQANGLKTIPVFSTLAKSLLSLNGILPIAFLLLQTMGKNLFGVSSGADAAKKSIDDLNKSFQKQNELLNENIKRSKNQTDLYNEILRERGASEREIFENNLKQRKFELFEANRVEKEALDELQKQQGVYNNTLIAVENATGKKLSESKKKNALSVVQAAEDNYKKAQLASEDASFQLLTFEKQFDADLAEDKREAAKKAADKAKKAGEDAAKLAAEIAERNRQARFEQQKLELQQTIDFNKEIVDGDSIHFTDRYEALQEYNRAKLALINLTADFETATNGRTVEELILIEKQRLDAILRLNREFAAEYNAIRKSISEGLKKDEKELQEGLRKIAEDGYKDWEKIQKARKDREKKDADERLKAAKEEAEKRKELEQKLINEITTLTFTLFTANIERQKNAIQALIDNLEATKQKDIEVETSRVQSTQDRAAAIAVIESRAAAQKEQLLKKQRDLDFKKAQFDKAKSIANIIQETAKNIVEVFPNPILTALAAAIGAVQLANVIATPIPRYKDGTGNHPGGPMIVGDGGKHEGVVFPDGTTMRTPATDTLMNAPAGTVVYPDFNKMMLNSTMTKPVEFRSKSVSDANVVKGLKAVEKAIKRIPVPVIKSEGRYKVMMKQGHSFRTYLNGNI